MSNKKSVINSNFDKLKNNFLKKHPKVAAWLLENHLKVEDLKTYAPQIMALSTVVAQTAVGQQIHADHHNKSDLQAINPDLKDVSDEEYEDLIQKMRTYVNQKPGHLIEEDQVYMEQQLSDLLGFPVAAKYEGQQLNHSIGIMGGEQHLRRYPNDTLADHDAFQEAGMAPNRGAFGWFTENGELTQRAIQREKYYFAVQTLYLPNWNTEYPTLKPWYKFRKMIVINPHDELAVVGVVGDAGPAMWVKKQFGGSPEIIREGKIWSPENRGRVILLFVDDPTDEIPLGVIDLKKKQYEEITKLAQR